jgi:hypothetical protein
MLDQSGSQIAIGGEEQIPRSGGLRWPMAAFFMVTDMSIAGQLALPAAIYGARKFVASPFNHQHFPK